MTSQFKPKKKKEGKELGDCENKWEYCVIFVKGPFKLPLFPFDTKTFFFFLFSTNVAKVDGLAFPFVVF